MFSDEDVLALFESCRQSLRRDIVAAEDHVNSMKKQLEVAIVDRDQAVQLAELQGHLIAEATCDKLAAQASKLEMVLEALAGRISASRPQQQHLEGGTRTDSYVPPSSPFEPRFRAANAFGTASRCFSAVIRHDSRQLRKRRECSCRACRGN